MPKKNVKLVALLGLSFVPALVLLSQSGTETKASVNNSTIIDDTFNNKANAGSLNSSIWDDHANSHIAQSIDGAAYLNLKSKNAGCENVVFTTKNKISDIHYYQFDFKYDGDSGRWFAPVFMNRNIDGSANWTKDYAYAGISNIGENMAASFGGTLSSSIDFETSLGVNAKESWLTCRITVTDSTNGTISFKKQEDVAFGSAETSFVYDKLSTDLTNSYVGIVVSHDDGSINFDNFVVHYGDNLEITEGFDHFDLEQPGDFTFFKDGESRVVEYAIVDSSTLELGGAKEGDFILSKKAIEGDASIVEEVEIVNLSLSVSFSSSATSEERIGLVFGLSEGENELKKNSVIYEIGKDFGLLTEYRDGVQTLVGSENKNRFEKVAGSGSIINVKIYKSGKFRVFENGSQVKSFETGTAFEFANIGDATGHFALAALTNLYEDVSIDNVKLINSLYYVPVTKSVTHNFSNSFFGNKGNEDFVVMNGDGGGELVVDGGKLAFNCGTDGTFFGSAHQYDDFILDFKLCSVLSDDSTEDPSKTATTLGRWIGLDLSREKKNYGAYGKYATLITQIVPNPAYGSTFTPALWSDPDISPFSKDDVRITVHKEIDVSLMQKIQYRDAMSEGNVKEGDALCFRFVSEGGNLKMFLKTAKETQYQLYYEVDGLSLNGYFALCCTGFTFIKIDDFSMTNTSSVYVCADNEEPKTITETETKVIYDNNNGDVHLSEEILLNAHANVLGIVFIVLSSLEAVGIGALLFVLLRRRKKQ